MKTLDLHLLITYRNKLFRVDRVFRGGFDDYATKFMDYMLEKAGKTDIDLIVVVYTELSARQKNMIREYLVPKHVVFFRSSAVMPIYMGVGTFGLMCFESGHYSSELLSMLEPAETYEEYDDPDEVQAKTLAENTEDTKRDTQKVEVDDTADVAAAPQPVSVSIDNIPGVDYQEGIKNSGNEDTYKALLEVFANSIGPNHDEICGFYDNEDWKNYTVKVHALKSSSRLIGALELSEEAKELEMAGKRDDLDYIRANHAQVMEHLKSFDPLLSAVFNKTPVIEEPAADAPVEETTSETTKEQDIGAQFESALIASTFEVIREAAVQHDDDTVMAAIEEIIDYPISMEDAEKLENLQMLLDSKEYEKMLSLIDG